MASAVSAVLLIIITLFCEYPPAQPRKDLKDELLLTQNSVPPVGVVIVAGCGADVLINICLTLLGYVHHISTSLPTTRPSRTAEAN